jgi:hypothetical protein
MMQIVLTGLGAGAASALLFASVKSGVILSVILFYLAPLPIMIAALGWSHLAALIAATSASAALGVMFGYVYFFVFLITIGLPAWWLGYLAMLARPSNDGAALEWYPPGRLVVWAALIGTLIVVAAIPTFGTDDASFRDGLRDALRPMVERMLAGDTDPAAQKVNVGSLTDLMAAILPPTAALLATITMSVNLWLAARIVSFSGRLNRPWPELPAMTFPPLVAATLLAAIVLSFFGGLVGIVATVLSATLLMAFAILGFAVLHAITKNVGSRAFILSGAYAATLVIGWPLLIMSLIGLSEAAFNIRARVGRDRGPPARV